MKVSVSPEWLRRNLSSKNVAVLDARSKGAYRRSHIRGAIHADLFHYFVPGTDRKGLGEFQCDLAGRLGRLGLNGRETIVVYESGFGMRAARVGWMLEYAGSPKVFLLEGGFRAWRKSGFPTERTVPRSVEQEFRLRPRPELIATVDEVRSSRTDLILDVRSEGEFTGRDKRDCDSRKGRIPRSRWLEWTNFIRDGQRFKSRSAMENDLRKSGVRRDRTVVTYCHRGARAAAAFYALRSLGYGRVKNYIGSWHEWSERKSLPIEQ